MKNHSIKKISLFAFLAIIFCGLFTFNFGLILTNNSASAEEAEKTSFTVNKYNNVTTTDTTGIELYTKQGEIPVTYYGQNPQLVKNTNATFINTSNIVKAVFKSNNDEQYEITSVSPILTIDGVNSSAAAQDKGIFLEIAENGFSVTAIPTLGECYGKYVLNVNYLLLNKSTNSITAGNFSYTYYVLKQVNYYNANNVNVTFNKLANSSSSSAYDRIFMYNYQDATKQEEFKPISLSFNIKNISLTITKRYQGITKSQSLTFNGLDLISSGSNILYYSQDNSNPDYVTIVLNDLGTYSIKYNFIYTYENNVDAINNYNTASEYSGKATDRVDVFGYQLFYSDINSSVPKEFKNISSNGTIGTELTDISYLLSNTTTTPLTTAFATTYSTASFFNSIPSGFTIQQTNQPPVQFQTNATIITESNCYSSTNSDGILSSHYSAYWKITKNETGYTTNEAIAYNNEPFSEAGIYLVNIVYKYDDYVGTNTSGTFSQWFIFEITTSTPSVNITTNPETGTGLIVTDGMFTNQSVKITKTETTISMFNSPTSLVVESANYGGAFGNPIVVNSNDYVIVSNNMKYKVTMYFGRGGSRYYTSYFTIDKTEIENIQTFNATPTATTSYVRSTEFNFWTNQNALVSWNEKTSGATVTAQYKYIPLEKDYATSYDNATLKQFYTRYAVPVEYKFNFSNTELTAINYENPQTDSYINSSKILSQSGMYIFKITDQAGNEKYSAIIIDKTQNQILQQTKDPDTGLYGDYLKTNGLNIVSSDTKISWGQFKVIKFNNLFGQKSNSLFTTQDSWLNTVLNSTNIINNNFLALTINTSTDYYMASQINQSILLETNGIPTFISSNSQNGYGYEIKFLDNLGNALENQYTFYTIDSLNTKTSTSTLSNYQNNFTGYHTVNVSSDASLTELYYSRNGEPVYLNRDSYAPAANFLTNTKEKYYQPTTAKTLTGSDEILNLRFNPTPQLGVIELSEVTYSFKPFTVSTTSPYHYTFANNTITGTIYSKTNPGENQTAKDGNFETWEILKEYNPQTQKYQTQAGKYVITRVYDNTLSGYADAVNNLYDFTTRTFTFIVDRYGIITSPVVVDTTTTTSYVGSAIKLQMLEGENAIIFNDAYVAQNQQNIDDQDAILITNKLPVQVCIPISKFGYLDTSTNSYLPEYSIESYSTTEIENLISTFKLTAEIRYSLEKSTLNQSSVVYTSSVNPDSNFLAFKGETIGTRTFTTPGFYKVTIYQGNSTKADQNIFSFTFKIDTDVPKFDFKTLQNTEILSSSSDTTKYYSNQEVVRLSWTDDSNQYKAIINPEQIKYEIINTNGYVTKSGLVDSTQIITEGYHHYVDFNLLENSAYVNGYNVKFTMQFEGEQSNYPEGNFTATKTLIIDTIAPVENINRLITNSGVQTNDVRNITDKYNTSVNSGIYKFFSFAVDKSQLADLIQVNETSDRNSITYRVFQELAEDGDFISTKYKEAYSQETSVETLENSSSDFEPLDAQSIETIISDSSYNKSYIEICERDNAGNITVYTIYITDKETEDASATTAIAYTINESSNISYITNNQINTNIELYARNKIEFNQINFMDYPWLKMNINNKSYLLSPYSNGKFYDLTSYNTENPNASLLSLKDFALLQTQSNKQVVTLNLVPYYSSLNINTTVLNTTLSIIHTSQTDIYANQEGLLIRIPSNITTNSASIYATSLLIKSKKPDDDTSIGLFSLINRSEYFMSTKNTLNSSTEINCAYVIYMGNTYIKFTVINPQTNNTYTYQVNNNFNETKTITNIYGSEVIQNELSSKVALVENYENGTKYYYSTENIEYKYNRLKDKIRLTVTTSASTNVYVIDNSTDINELNLFSAQIFVPSNSYINTVRLQTPTQNMANGNVGSVNKFKIEVFSANDNELSAYNVINLKTYNIVPKINLLSENLENQNKLFNKETLFGGELTINYSNVLPSTLPYTVYLKAPNGTISEIISGTKISEEGTYTIIISYNEVLIGTAYNQEFEFTLSKTDMEFYNVSYTNNGIDYVYANATGKPFTYFDSTASRTITTHYIVNSVDFKINCNTIQNVVAQLEDTRNISGYMTYIYSLNNTGSVSETSFSRTIAVTVIPYTNNILTSFAHYTEQGLSETLLNNTTVKTFTLNTTQDSSVYKRISWTSFYGIKENTVKAEIFFGDNKTPYISQVTTINNISNVTLTTSGIYYFVFKDLAGNVHMFDTVTDTYTIRYLRSVIYTIQGESPINNAVYDTAVTINVPTATLRYYDTNSRPQINVELNGVKTTINSSNSSYYTYILTEPGLYKVWFSAKVDEKSINEEPIYFLIVNPNETRWAYEFAEYSTYYIEKIVKNQGLNGEQDYTSRLTNLNMGSLVTINNKEYLKNVVISLNDEQTGVGKWTITVATNNAFSQTFTFTIWINNINELDAPLRISIKENESTTDLIKLTFNTQNMLDYFGDCKVVIEGMDDFEIYSSLLASGDLKETYTITITKNGKYNIQILSQSGKLLYTYRVIKVEPLNTISIVLIVVGSLLIVGITIMFILLRKKMKIR